jgi:hypothetical protein
MKTKIGRIYNALTVLCFDYAFSQTIKHQPIITNLPATPTLSPSTVPRNGDLNPSGVA